MADDKNKDQRLEFVRAMYGVYWANMARSMDGVWQILGPITVTGTVIAGVHKDYLPGPLGISLAMLIVIWGINATIDLNAWHRRNLFFATKAEQEFLTDADYGKLLPSRYKRPSRRWIAFYSINVTVFLVFLGLTAVYGLSTLEGRALCLPVVVFLVGIVLTVLNAVNQEESAKKHLNELFGEEPQAP